MKEKRYCLARRADGMGCSHGRLHAGECAFDRVYGGEPKRDAGLKLSSPERFAPAFAGRDPRPGFLAFANDRLLQAGERILVVSVPQMAFRGVRLVIDPACAEGLDLLDIRIGRDSLFANSTPAFAGAFPPLPAEADFERMDEWFRAHMLDAPTASVGQQAALSIGNRSATKPTASPFRALLWGFWEVP